MTPVRLLTLSPRSFLFVLTDMKRGKTCVKRESVGHWRFCLGAQNVTPTEYIMSPSTNSSWPRGKQFCLIPMFAVGSVVVHTSSVVYAVSNCALLLVGSVSAGRHVTFVAQLQESFGRERAMLLRDLQ